MGVGYVGIDVTVSLPVIFWFIRNLLFTVVAEEILFRQVIQFLIETALKGKHAKLLALAVASVLFGLVTT